jgi:tripartite ATP-independent transporter DctP family solute receptor
MERRRIVLCLCLIMIVFLFVGRPSVWAQQKVVKVKMATAMPDSHPNAISVKYLSERIGEVSGGQIEREVFTAGSVGGEDEIVESVSLGMIQIYMGATAPLVNYVPQLSIFDLPYLFKNRDHVDKVLWGAVGNEITELTVKKGFRILGWADSGFQGFYNSRRPITSLADMKGLKMRVMKNNIRVKAMNGYGASAVPLAWTETYGAMETKVVDGCENSYETYRSGTQYEVAKYFTESDHAFMTATIIVNEKFYQSLSPKVKAVIQHACGLSSLRYRQLFEEKNIEAKKIVQEKGAVVNVLSDAAKKDFRKAAQPAYDDYSKAYGVRLLDQIRAAE